jgi:hypothetical protein
MVWSEAKLARKRVNHEYRTQATITLIACATAFGGGKKASKNFQEFLENFSDGEDD